MLDIDSLKNTIVCGDCLPILKDMPDKCIDLVLCDPPYGIGGHERFNHQVPLKRFGTTGKKIHRRQYMEDDWDISRPSKQYFDEILRVGKNIVIFGGNYFADMLPLGTHWYVWDKKNTLPSFSDAELIWTNNTRKSVKIIERQYNGLLGKEYDRFHPTQKPVDIMRFFVREIPNTGIIVLDPFAGSGTTCVAAKMEGRNYIGIEIAPKYCEIARERLKSVTQKLL